MNFGRKKKAANEPVHQYILFNNKNYTVISAENEFILHPAALGLVPMSAEYLGCPFTCNYSIDDYHIFLDSLTMKDYKDTDGGQKTASVDSLFINKPVYFNGAVLIGCDPVMNLMIDNKPACFSYKNVYELVFNNGVLKTTVDHSKAMLRIRRNLDLGLRNLDKRKDAACIRRFIKSSLIGDYKPHSFTLRKLRYLKDMKTHYQ